MKRRTKQVAPVDLRQLRYKTVADADVETLRTRTGKSARRDEYMQCCVYLRHKTKAAATRRLLDEGSKEDFSDLLERLLATWLAGDRTIKPT